jgi:hypothetical protein
MKIFETGIANVLIRYYVMMAFVITMVFLRLYWLLPVAMVVFLYAMLGVSFKKKNKH